VTPPDDAVDTYAVSPSGVTAYVSDGALRLVVPEADPLFVDDAEPQRLIWSRDGRRLAYENQGVWSYDVVGGRRTLLAEEGSPKAWSRDASQLLVMGRDSPELIDVQAGSSRTLPVAPAADAGWLSDRDTIWLADPGLRLVTLRDTLLVTTLFESGETRHVFVRPDHKLLLWVTGDLWTPNLVDLTAPVLGARPLGPQARIPLGGEYAWAPDGRHGALASSGGLVLVDPTTGAQVPLSSASASDPQWVFRSR
jgi:hypothetical protein